MMHSFMIAALIAALGAEGNTIIREPLGTTISQPGNDAAIMHLQFDRTGGAIADDTNTVAHVTFNGTSIVDPYNTWTQNGTVPQNVASPFYPDGFSGTQKKAAGVFSDVNYYSAPIFLTSGNFTLCATSIQTVSNAFSFVLSTGASGASGDGWTAFIGGGGSQSGIHAYSAGNVITPATSAISVLQAANIICVGRSGGSIYSKLNLAVTVTAVATDTPSTQPSIFLGRNIAAGGPANGGSTVEVWITSTPFDEANVTAIQRRYFGMLGARGEAITAAHTSIGTYTTPDGKIWTAPANIARVGCEDTAAAKCGILVEAARVNLVLQSEALDTAVTWVATNETVTANQCSFPIGPAGATTMESLVSTVNTGTNAQALTVTSSVGPHTMSSYLVATTGTQTGTIGMTFGTGNATSCSCVRSDGGACTTATATATGYAYATVGTTPVRLTLSCSTTLAATAITAFVTGGQYLTSTGTICAGGVQFEQGASYATSYIATAGTAVARTVDLVTAANPFVTLNPSSWCMEAIGSPALRSWGVDGPTYPFLLGFGTNGVANTVRLLDGVSAPNEHFGVFDAAGAERAIETNLGFTGGTPHRLSAESVGGAIRLLADGVSVGTPAGAGTGIVTTWPANLSVGSDGVAAFPFSGYIRDVKLWKRACR